MKWLTFWRNLKFSSSPRDERRDYILMHNDEKVDGLKVINFRSTHECYKKLRAFKTPQYTDIYVMRKKKAFNTIGFQQKYDVVVTDPKGLVLFAQSDIETGYISNVFDNGFSVYFMVVGQINDLRLKVKDRMMVLSDYESKYKSYML